MNDIVSNQLAKIHSDYQKIFLEIKFTSKNLRIILIDFLFTQNLHLNDTELNYAFKRNHIDEMLTSEIK